MIYTSYFGRVKELEKNGIEPIAISRSVPAGFAGRRIMELAPTWQMLKMSDAEYDRHYELILARMDRDELVKSFGDRDVALLCWEKNVNDCHRKRVGEWLREGGYDAVEYGLKKEQKPEPKETEQKKPEEKWYQLSLFCPPLA